MRVAPLACVAVALLATATQADFVSESTFSYGSRQGIASTLGGPYTINGGAGGLFVVIGGTEGRTSPSNFEDAGFKFALNSFAAGAQIISATLSLTAIQSDTSVDNTSPTIPVALTALATSLNPLTLGDFGPLSSTPTISVPSNLSVNTPVTINVTALVQSLEASGAAAVFFQLDDPEAQSGITFAAPPLGASLQPVLTITYNAVVPEPASWLLLVVGGALVGWRQAKLAWISPRLA